MGSNYFVLQEKLPNGKYSVMARAEGDGIIGDALLEMDETTVRKLGLFSQQKNLPAQKK